MDRELEELREEIEKLLPLIRLFEQLDFDLRNRDDLRSLREALRLLRRLRETPNIDQQFDLLRRLAGNSQIDAHLAMLSEMYDSRIRTRAEVRAVGWDAVKKAAGAVVLAAGSIVAGILFQRHGGG